MISPKDSCFSPRHTSSFNNSFAIFLFWYLSLCLIFIWFLYSSSSLWLLTHILCCFLVCCFPYSVLRKFLCYRKWRKTWKLLSDIRISALFLCYRILCYPRIALHTARFTLYSILCTACKGCCSNTFTAETMSSLLQKIISLAESEAAESLSSVLQKIISLAESEASSDR